jgi:tetratricopeptide (TPR) repeat protein
LTGLAYSHLNLASINGTLHPDTAEAEYREGLKIWKRMAREHPEVPGYTVRFAESVGYFGDMLRMNRRLDEAAEAYQTALRISSETVAPGIDALNLRRVAAYARFGLGRTHSAALRWADAIASLNEAARLYDELIAEIPAMSAVVEMQVMVDESLADAYREIGNSEAELQWRRRNVADGRRLLALGATDDKYAESLAAAIERLGDALTTHGRHAEAELAFREVLDQRQTSRPEPGIRFRDAYRIKEKLVTQLAEQGRTDEAVDVCRECEELCRSWVAARPDQRLAKRSLHDVLKRLADLVESGGFVEQAGRLRSEAIGLESSDSFRRPGNVSADIMALREEMDSAERTRLASRPAQAIEQIDRVLAALARFEDQISADRFLRKVAVDAHAGRAMSLSALGRHAEAVGNWERAILYDRDGRAWIRINCACDLALAGRIEDAAQAVDDALRQFPDLKPIELRAAAGAMAACAQVVPVEGRRFREYSQVSLQLLQRAIGSGYQNVAELDADRQFSVIRALSEYATLTAPLREGQAAGDEEPSVDARAALDKSP